jgi:anti-sigma regulatory factor (Ser/Thr protein kinase)
MGFIKAVRSGPDGNSHFTAFLMDAQRAARDVACPPGSVSGQLAAAMEELENNIHEHSDAATTGLLAFRAAPGAFEFVVADRGIGILTSLRRCPLYTAVSDHGKALESALTDGISRFGSESGRGHGFRPIFLGLANLRGSLRFRSGDHALLIDGTSPSLMTARLAQKPLLDGFFASISCHARAKR